MRKNKQCKMRSAIRMKAEVLLKSIRKEGVMGILFSGKTVLITGAASGMGRACALAFANQQANVAVVDIDRPLIKALATEISQAGGKCLACPGDVSSSREVAGIAAKVGAAFGPTDILVNNAGVLRQTSPAEAITEEEWDLVMDVNLKGCFLAARAVLPAMRQKGWGRIINISSSAGRSTSELGGAHYTASKAGLLGLTRHLAREYGRFGINVNSICPGLVDTPMIHQQADEKRLGFWRKQIPLGRFAKPEEEADLVLFLASDKADYITGATIDFNGGSLLV